MDGIPHSGFTSIWRETNLLMQGREDLPAHGGEREFKHAYGWMRNPPGKLP